MLPTDSRTARTLTAAEHARDPHVTEIAEAIAIRSSLDRIREYAPAAGAAAGLIFTGTAGIPVVAIDPSTMAASSDPLRSGADVVAHFTTRPNDGVGLITTTRLIGLAVRRKAAWIEWLTERGVDVRTGTHPDSGRVIEERVGRDHGSPIPILWNPPPIRQRTATGLGQIELDRIADAFVSVDRTAGARAWLAIKVAPGQITGVRGRRLTNDLEVLPAGSVLPWHIAAGASGWELTASRHPVHGLERELAPPWLLRELGVTWPKRAA